jgi:hypothetical protein
MRLIDELERLAVAEESLFRRQLLREDVARLRKLEALAQSAADLEAFKKSGMRLGWTQGDARTAELAEPLCLFLQVFYERDEAQITAAWNELHRTRMERLLGCLSTPVPKPAGE